MKAVNTTDSDWFMAVENQIALLKEADLEKFVTMNGVWNGSDYDQWKITFERVK